jgi:hypothetical protein
MIGELVAPRALFVKVDLSNCFVNKLAKRKHRHGWDGPTNSNSGMAFAWFCWDRDHKGPTELHRLSWENA